MAEKSSLPKPSDGELAILQVLWRLGSATVREVYEQLDSGTGYTTALKLMQIMTDKGLVVRNDDQRAHVYSAAVARDEVEAQLVEKIAVTAFEGSFGKLALRALGAKNVSKDEIAEIRALLDAMEKRKGGSR